jgi:hypothetical protein
LEQRKFEIFQKNYKQKQQFGISPGQPFGQQKVFLFQVSAFV